MCDTRPSLYFSYDAMAGVLADHTCLSYIPYTHCPCTCALAGSVK